jgi:hypothetical protein
MRHPSRRFQSRILAHMYGNQLDHILDYIQKWGTARYIYGKGMGWYMLPFTEEMIERVRSR